MISSTFILFFVCGIVIVVLMTRQKPLSLSALSAGLVREVHADPDSLYNAWEGNETCEEWISVLRENEAYIDAYVVGSQKAGTTQVAQMLELLNVRRKDMIKEWHFYNHLTADGMIMFGRFETDPLPPMDNLTHLQLMHYQLGFPTLNVTSLPPLDDSVIDERTVVVDSTVEYLHMERAALLAHLLTPHSRIIIMIRDPIARALSHYNMNRRNTNRKLRERGSTDHPATEDEFDIKVKAEIDVLRKCGYNDSLATLHGNSTRLIRCMRMQRPRIDDVMYVFRGVYFLHILPWLDYFPRNRILFVPFADLARGYPLAYQRITQFLCVRPFSDLILKSVDSGGSNLSFGERAAREGLSKLGQDEYMGNDRYLPTMHASTRKLLEDFYAPANKKLELLIGRPMF